MKQRVVRSNGECRRKLARGVVEVASARPGDGQRATIAGIVRRSQQPLLEKLDPLHQQRGGGQADVWQRSVTRDRRKRRTRRAAGSAGNERCIANRATIGRVCHGAPGLPRFASTMGIGANPGPSRNTSPERFILMRPRRTPELGAHAGASGESMPMSGRAHAGTQGVAGATEFFSTPRRHPSTRSGCRRSAAILEGGGRTSFALDGNQAGAFGHRSFGITRSP